MRLGLVSGYSGPKMHETMQVILEAERLGFDSVWTGEAWGSDVVSFLAFVGARTSTIKLGAGILQMQARTPAMTAMTAMTLDGLTNGRFLIGLGPSNPQVIEGWHGVAYGKPLQRYREYIDIIRRILVREQKLRYDGQEYQIPYAGPDASGLGKPLKSILHGRPDMQIYTASIGPKGIALAAELADGLLPVWMSPDWCADYYTPQLEAGLCQGRQRQEHAQFRSGAVCELRAGRRPRTPAAPRSRPAWRCTSAAWAPAARIFYNSYVRNFGYEGLAGQLQDLYLSGRKAEAQAAVPDELVDAVALVGPQRTHCRAAGAAGRPRR